MGKERCLLGCLKENKKGRHAEFISASHLIAVSKRGEILKSILQTPYTNLTGRGQVVKAAVQDDDSFYNGGFTLIELLVVVLIIGILAVVALPQYKVAVEKARMAEAMTILKSVKEAQERYYLANGDYATKFEDLDIDIAGTMNVAGTIITLPSGVRIGVAFNNTGATNKNNTISLISFYTHTLSDLRQCYAKQNDVVANQVCKNLGGKIPYDSSGGCAIGACTIYTL